MAAVSPAKEAEQLEGDTASEIPLLFNVGTLAALDADSSVDV